MLKNIDRWLISYITQEIKQALRKHEFPQPAHIMFCFADHYEPDWNNADAQTQTKRVKRWTDNYPPLARRHKDADGCFPKHTFFYPAEIYVKEHLELLSDLVKKGFGEVEVHLHHDNDTEEGLRQKLEKAKEDFVRHGFLGKRTLTNQVRFAFIHGNWCLNNSRRDGRWCGVNDEARILKDAGCYADFTFPSAPSETQPRKINSIYYTHSRKDRSKTHNSGVDVRAGQFSNGDLMIIQGPLTFNWRKPVQGILPRIENSDVTGTNPPTQDRVDLWIKQRIAVHEKPDWIFIKVHTHGAVEKNADCLLDEPMHAMLTYLESKYNDGKNFVLHYVTAREMYNIIKAAEAGEKDNPHLYRNYMIERNL